MPSLYANLLVTEEPNILEIALLKSLDDSLWAAVRYAIQTLANNSLNKWILSTKIYDEQVILALNMIVQTHFIKNYSASFAEHFYGLKRVKVEHDVSKKYGGLRSHDMLFSLIEICAWPFFRLLLQHLIKKTKESRKRQSNSAPERLTLSDALKLIIVKLFPVVSFLLRFPELCFQFMFALNATRYPSFGFFLFGWQLRRLDMADYQKFSNLDSLIASEGSIISRSLSRAFKGFQLLLAFSALGFKVLEFYYSAENVTERQAATQKRSLTIAPPLLPKALPSYSDMLRGKNTNQGDCSLCLRVLRTPTIDNSGHVFCNTCIGKFVQENGFSPVTGRPCTLDKLIKIYET